MPWRHHWGEQQAGWHVGVIVSRHGNTSARGGLVPGAGIVQGMGTTGLNLAVEPGLVVCCPLDLHHLEPQCMLYAICHNAHRLLHHGLGQAH